MAKRKATKKTARKKTPKKPPGRPAKTKAAAPSLGSLRRKIDRKDGEIVDLINERARLAVEIGKLKDSSGQKVYAPEREEKVLGQAAAHNPGPLSEQCIRAVMREVISGSRAVEKKLRVAFLGPAYSYSHVAAIHRFGQCVDFLPVGTIASVFEEVHAGHADYGIAPIENSTDGRIADTLHMFTQLPVKICAEVNMRIHHNLLGKCPRSEVKEVYSRPQALSQCRKWLSTHLPQARTIEVTSTSTAADLARDKPGAAAVASVQAGINYGLNVLASDIEDNQDNLTRFAVISHQPAHKSGNDKTSIMFQVEHRAGTLADVTVILKRARINLTWIESFPIAGARGEYLFFIELDGHQDDTKVKRTLASLEKKTTGLEILGSYAKSVPVE